MINFETKVNRHGENVGTCSCFFYILLVLHAKCSYKDLYPFAKGVDTNMKKKLSEKLLEMS